MTKYELCADYLDGSHAVYTQSCIKFYLL